QDRACTGADACAAEDASRHRDFLGDDGIRQAGARAGPPCRSGGSRERSRQGSAEARSKSGRGFRRSYTSRSGAGRSEGPGRAHAPGGEADVAGHRLPGRKTGRRAAVERPAGRSRRQAGADADPPASRREVRTDRAAVAVAAGQRQHQRRLQGAPRRRRRAGQAGRPPGVARRPVAGARRRTGAGGMKAALRIPFVVVGLLVLAWVGWTAIQVTRADALAQTDPEAALRIDPDHPQALLRLAWRQLGNDQTEAAMATARHLLAVEPGQGDAFAVLALAAAKRGDANAEALAKIAL